MKCCSKHLYDLTKMIRRKGMGHLLTDERSAVSEKAQRWLLGATRPEEFDPRVVSILELYKKAAEVCGEYVRQKKENGNWHCPLCEVPKVLQQADADSIWIDNVTDQMVIFCHVNHIQLRSTH